jgi:hypothetical protein
MIGKVFEISNEIISGYRSGHRRDTQSLSITMTLQRTLTALYRKLYAYRSINNSSLRKELLNGNKMRMLSALKGEQYRKNL